MVGIGIGNIIKITANDHWVWTFIELVANLVGLLLPETICLPEFPEDGPGLLQRTVGAFLDVFHILEFRSGKQQRLKVGGEHPDDLPLYVDVCLYITFIGL